MVTVFVMKLLLKLKLKHCTFISLSLSLFFLSLFLPCLHKYRLWQKLGYLIIYITGRPILQKEYINSWLAFHKFPLGVVSFSDTLSTDNHSIKLLYLARLMKEVDHYTPLCFIVTSAPILRIFYFPIMHHTRG